MSGQSNLSIKPGNVSQNLTIMPRLYYSHELLGRIVYILEEERLNLKKLNKHLSQDISYDSDCPHEIDLERNVSFSLETLKHIQKKVHSFSRIDQIPKIFPPLVPVIRTLSANLHYVLPQASKLLAELSVHLGSIVLDSAILTKAQFDFGKTSLESTSLLDEVKLMVDSKISKQYPHLDFF